MKLIPHTTAGLIVGGIIGVATQEPLAVPVAIAAAVLPDTDHLLDFYWHYIRRSRARLFLLFHGWEFVIILHTLNNLNPSWWMASITAGYLTQILLDQIGNNAKWNTYFFTWRAWNRFRRWESYGKDSPGLYKALTDSLPWLGPKMEPWFKQRDEEMYPEIYISRVDPATAQTEIEIARLRFAELRSRQDLSSEEQDEITNLKGLLFVDHYGASIQEHVEDWRP
ncbi:hypothetical protein LCGC14_1148130 [marine sediment metagenome]|uniref:Uncharacterized protein n=1 Tax=marine sediment metagenome TaxID=412755 RepID=A0A0F9LWC2_9ZZZZ